MYVILAAVSISNVFLIANQFFNEVNRHSGVCKMFHCVYFFRTNYSFFLAPPPTSPPNLKKTDQKGGPNHS